MCKFKRCDKYLFKDNILMPILFQIKRPCYLGKKSTKHMASVIKYLMYKCFLYVSLPQGIIFKMGSPTGHGGRELKQNRACMWIPCKFTPTSWFHIIKLQFSNFIMLQFTHVWNHTSVQSKPSEMWFWLTYYPVTSGPLCSLTCLWIIL